MNSSSAAEAASGAAARAPTDPALQAALVRARCGPGVLAPRGATCIETHISYVLLTGTHAYKIKKAVALPFLDFTTLAARRRYCDEELRLNRRLAPQLYLDVVPITGTPAQPRAAGTGAAQEYALRMREFPQEALWCNVLERDELEPRHIDALAVEVASFHARAPRAPPASGYGEQRGILATALANFETLETRARDPSERAVLTRLERWTRHGFAACRDAFDRRVRQGAIRECHGDLHLANIALIDDAPVIFDCIEFDPALRFIDPLSEVAFTVMDIDHRGHPMLARRFLSAYLEQSGDYGGVPVLRFYLVYRAMVRAKIDILRAAQAPAAAGRAAFAAEERAYLQLAAAYARPSEPAVVLMHGLSGCGKTVLSELILERTGAVRIRTDVERKRLAGLGPAQRSGSGVARGIYDADSTRRTYEHVLACARDVLEGGFGVILDGAFLHRWQRDLFRSLAQARGLPFVIVDCNASEDTLRQRVEARARAARDASEADLAVLSRQIDTREALAPEERAVAVAFDTDIPLAQLPRHGSWRLLLRRMGIALSEKA